MTGPSCLQTDFYQAACTPTVFFVDTTLDLLDQNPGDGECLTAQGTCSLRAAIQESNANGKPEETIYLPPGYYALTRYGPHEDGAKTGDLDVLSDLHLVGAGTDDTVIDGWKWDRVFEIVNYGMAQKSSVMITSAPMWMVRRCWTIRPVSAAPKVRPARSGRWNCRNNVPLKCRGFLVDRMCIRQYNFTH